MSATNLDGHPRKPRSTTPVIERVFRRVDKNGPVPEYRPDLGACWIWGGAKNVRNGYGHIGVSSRKIDTVHRVVYAHVHGEIPDGLVVDHLCRVPACCNPDHLEAVTNAENVRRGYRSRKACPNGHVYSEATVFYRGEWRCCRLCRDESNARLTHRRRAARVEKQLRGEHIP